MAFVLSNQAFPAELPSNTEKQCLFIMRIENSSITNLVDKFLNITRGWKLPPGTILVVSSATRLERCGIAAYTAALANNGGRVQRVFSGQIVWIPGPPILHSGTNCGELIRGLVKMAVWVKFALPEPANTLGDSFCTLVDILKASTVGSMELPAERRFMLPCTLTHLPDMKTWASVCAEMPLPTAVKAFSEEMEVTIISTMLKDINSKLGFDLELEPNFSRILDTNSKSQPNVGGGFLLVGSSNADRSVTALREEGDFVDIIKVSLWKPKPEAVAALTDHVREALGVGQTRVTVSSSSTTYSTLAGFWTELPLMLSGTLTAGTTWLATWWWLVRKPSTSSSSL